MNSFEQQLQSLINQMQENADRIVNMWSNAGDAMLRYNHNQDALVADLVRILSDGMRRPQQPLHAEYPPQQTMPEYGGYPGAAGGTGAVAYNPYPQGQMHPQQTKVASNAGNGYQQGEYPGQGYPPQPYQEQQAAPEDGTFRQLMTNLRRQQP